jgi:hypothetical protein
MVCGDAKNNDSLSGYLSRRVTSLTLKIAHKKRLSPAKKKHINIMTTLALSPTEFQPHFDYGDIPSALQTQASSLVSSIRVCLKKFNAEALELARQINPIREQMSARQFKAWLTHYFPDAETQIRHWLKVVELAERLPEHVEQMMGWASGALAALSRGSDELVTSILSGEEKLSIKAIKALVTQERLEQNINSPTDSTSSSTDSTSTSSSTDSTSPPPSSNASSTQSTSSPTESSSTSSPASSSPTPSQPSETIIQLAKLLSHKSDLHRQLDETAIPEVQERLLYYIKQADREIQQLCPDLNPTFPAPVVDSEIHQLQSQLQAEQQKSKELSNQLEQLRQQLNQLQPVSNDNSTQQPQTTDTNSPDDELDSEEFNQLQSQLDAEQQKNRELLNRIETLEQQLTQQQPQTTETHSPDSELLHLQEQLITERQKNTELLNQLAEIQKQQSQEDLPFLKIFRPKFVPVKVEDLQVNDRIRVIAPDKKTVVDDLILSIDETQRPVTKWFGAIWQQEVEAGWTFKRMLGVEKIQSQLDKLLQENQQLKCQVNQLENIRINHSDSPLWQLEKRLSCLQSEYQQLKDKSLPVLGCFERLQEKIHNQLQPGTVVEILFDDQGIYTGQLGTVEQEFECTPGNWWVSFVDPDTQQTYRGLFHAYQLYLPPF